MACNWTLAIEVLLARSLLSATPDDRADLLDSVRQALGVPMVGVISDGQSSLRGAVAKALPDVPHQLCHVHSLREAAKSVYEADRPAKKALKKRVRGVRPMARQLEKRTAPEAAVMRGYGSAVRRARTDDGYPPLAAAGLTRHDRLTATSQRLERVGKRGGLLKPFVRLHTRLQRGWTEPAPLWPEVHVAYRGVHRAAHILTNEDQQPRTTGQHRLSGLLGAMMRHCTAAGLLVPALGNFLKVTRSDWPGLFHCDELPDLPRTNNDLEQRCGAHRSHERRATGRKSASPALVRRGAVQLIAAMATRLRVFAAWELAPEAARAWQSLRHDLDTRRHRRTLQRRFRHNPASYLAELEAALLKLSLPP